MQDFDPGTARKILRIESQTWRYAGRKETHVRDVLGVSITRYYQLLNQLLDTETALQVDPFTTRRLQRIRTQRQSRRA